MASQIGSLLPANNRVENEDRKAVAFDTTMAAPEIGD